MCQFTFLVGGGVGGMGLLQCWNACLLLSHLLGLYEGCSNMNASGFITFFTYMLRQNGIRFYKGLYVTFKLAPVLK